jgi:hypothetical protein
LIIHIENALEVSNLRGKVKVIEIPRLSIKFLMISRKKESKRRKTIE